MNGLDKEQYHRTLEDLETVAMAIRLLKQVMDNLYRDAQKMLKRRGK